MSGEDPQNSSNMIDSTFPNSKEAILSSIVKTKESYVHIGRALRVLTVAVGLIQEAHERGDASTTAFLLDELQESIGHMRGGMAQIVDNYETVLAEKNKEE